MSLCNFYAFTLFKLQQEPAIWECQDPAFRPVADGFNFDKRLVGWKEAALGTIPLSGLVTRRGGACERRLSLTSCTGLYLIMVTNLEKESMHLFWRGHLAFAIHN